MIKVWYGVIVGLFAAYIWTLTVAVPSVQIHRSAFRDCNSKHCTLQATGPFTTGDSLQSWHSYWIFWYWGRWYV